MSAGGGRGEGQRAVSFEQAFGDVERAADAAIASGQGLVSLAKKMQKAAREGNIAAVKRAQGKNPAMARDFRAAMTWLCEQTGDRPDGSYDGQPLLDWLTGADTRLSPVRPFLIHTAVNRATARHFIESALH